MNQTKSLISKVFTLSALAISLAFVPISHAILTSPIEETTYAWTGTQTPSVTESYYSQASGLTGSALKSALFSFNKPTSTSYDWSRYEAADEAYNDSSSIISLYTRHNILKSAHVGSYSWTTWNREHVYPQGNFPNSDTDNHNIFACEGQINNYRGNLSFGEVTHNSTNQLTVFGHLTDNYRANSLFEPCDEAKGEVARAVLYTSLYYNYTISSIFSSEAVCLKWHAQFPVTEREIFRNNKVHALQKNRNPFVDHPSYANSIYNPSTPYTAPDPLGGSSSTAPNTITLSPSTPTIAVAQSVTLNVTVDTGSPSVTWASSNNSIATVSGGIVTGVAVGTATITATSTINTSVKGTATITVKSLSSLNLSGTATNISYSAGQSFNPAGLTITATYSDSSTANVTSSVVWTPSPLTQGTTSVTGSYGGKTVSVSGLTVVADALTNVSVTNDTTYHPGETITKNDITVTLNYESGASNTTTNFTFANEGYQFTYLDANSGGSNTSKQFSVVYGGNSYNFSVNVSRISYSIVSDSAKALTGTEFNGSTVSKSSSTPSSTAVTIGGVNFTVTTNAYIYSSCLSFAKNAGSINNSTAFSSDLTSVSFVQKSGNRQDGVLSISKDGSTWATYSEAEIANSGYRFFKIEYTGTSTFYSNISSISFTLAGEDNSVNVSNYVMYEDTDNQCTTKLSEAIDKLNTMSETEKNTFWTSSDYVISTSRERLLAWATHEGKELTYSDGVFQISNSRNIASISNQSNNSLIIMVVSMFGLTAVGGFFFLRRKKEK